MNAPSNWWETFFSGVAVDMWKDAIPPAMSEGEAELVLKLLDIDRGSAVLDVPCGVGRIAIPFARRGYRVTGVDLSEESLVHAREASSEVTWEHRDMRDLPWRGAFDGAYCVGNSFGYLDDAGNEAFLRSVATALKPGGTFVLETPMAAESALLTIKERGWWKAGGDIHLLVANQFDPASGRMETEYTFVSNGRVEVRRGTHRVYTYRQLVELMSAAGFSSVAGWTFDHTSTAPTLAPIPYRVGAPMLLLVGRIP